MSYQKLPFKPGIYKDDSPLAAKGYWIDSDKIRFVRGLPETIYGWENASNTALLGLCRGAMAWTDNARNPFAAFGTHLRLYAMDIDGNVTDATPVIARGTLGANPFTTQNGSASVSVAHTAHGLVANQKVNFANAAVFNGVTIAGDYAVQSVTDANDYVIVSAATANASGSGGGSSVYYQYSLAPGNQDGIGGLGFGVGGYGEGGYGNPAAGFTYWPLTWSLDAWGENLIANPRGGGLYEWAPNTAAAELVPDTTFATSWTLGSGWSQSGGVLTASSASSAASCSVTLPIAAWCLIQIDVATASAGNFQASVGGVNVGTTIGATGHKFIGPFFSGAGGSQTLAITGSSFSGTLQNPDCKVLTTANQIPNAPAQATSIFVSPERILVACGCTNASGNFDPLNVSWTDVDNNQTWIAAATNLAGSYLLSEGSRVVRGLPGRAENIVFTDTALYAMRYVPDPTVVYSFTLLGSGCGLIGPNAVAQVGGIFYWMDPAGGFWIYDGSFPQPLPSTLARFVRDHLAPAQQDKIYAVPVTVNGRIEVWWSYPDARDGTECSRYVIYHVTESAQQGMPVWGYGTFNRTAWIAAGVYPYPLAVDSAGGVWYQEKGFTQNGGVRSWSIASAYFDTADGADQTQLLGVLPDADDLQGAYAITVNANLRNGSGILSRTFGPYSVTSATGKVSARANGEEMQLVFSGTASPAFWRMGAIRLDLRPLERSR